MEIKNNQSSGHGGRREGAGRPAGAKNKLTGDLRAAIIESFEQVGGVDYLVAAALSNPKAYLSLLSKIVPREIEADINAKLALHVLSGVPDAADASDLV